MLEKRFSAYDHVVIIIVFGVLMQYNSSKLPFPIGVSSYDAGMGQMSLLTFGLGLRRSVNRNGIATYQDRHGGERFPGVRNPCWRLLSWWAVVW
jgi:hypothetical protein